MITRIKHLLRSIGARGLAGCFLLVLIPREATGSDWPGFRGPGGLGRSASGAPLTWSEDRNVAWRRELPGAGASSPIVLGDRIGVTFFTGGSGDLGNLKRHLVCLKLADGGIVWESTVPAELPEQERIREEHGYASSTPAADGERVYTFFGKTGAFAFDHQGKQVWQTKLGDQLNGWGSATSPTLYKDLVIFNASVESEALVALDKKTGREVWRAGGIKESWHAPVLVQGADGGTEVVVAMLRKVLAFDADRGVPLWNCDTSINWYMCPTPVAEKGIVYSIGGRNPNGALAIRAGGRGEVTGTHVLWKLNKGSNVPSPILHEGHLYFAHENLGIVYCVNAETGALVFEERLQPSPGQIYASPVLAGSRCSKEAMPASRVAAPLLRT